MDSKLATVIYQPVLKCVELAESLDKQLATNIWSLYGTHYSQF